MCSLACNMKSFCPALYLFSQCVHSPYRTSILRIQKMSHTTFLFLPWRNCLASRLGRLWPVFVLWYCQMPFLPWDWWQLGNPIWWLSLPLADDGGGWFRAATCSSYQSWPKFNENTPSRFDIYLWCYSGFLEKDFPSFGLMKSSLSSWSVFSIFSAIAMVVDLNFAVVGPN